MWSMIVPVEVDGILKTFDLLWIKREEKLVELYKIQRLRIIIVDASSPEVSQQ